MKPRRLRLAVVATASCGGCELALLNVGEPFFALAEGLDVVFAPFLADARLDALKALPDRSVDLCLLNGAIRSTGDREMASLLRRKSRILVAFGSCAHEGCIPGLANLSTPGALLDTVYLSSPATANPERVLPSRSSTVPGGELALPVLLNSVLSLGQVERVDYVIPGCPPEPHQVGPALAWLVAALRGEEPLPPGGATLGAGRTSVCEECPLPRSEPRVTRFYRPHEKVPEGGSCLLDQGFVCSGPATRDGCGALCPRVGMGCRGCYGPTEGISDPGAQMVGALASVLRAGAAGLADPSEQGEAALRGDLRRAAESVVDPAGTLYRHSLAHAPLLHPAPEVR